jgi:hypothetical protein
MLKKADDPQSYYKYNQELPLSVGNYWAYQVTRYDGFNPNDIMTATFSMTDTITSIEIKDGFFVATVQSERSAEIPIEVRGNYPVTDAVQPATTVNYWLVVDSNRVIRQDRLNLTDFPSGGAIVEFAFPMSLGSKWSMYYPKDAPINRAVTSVGAAEVPAGKFTDCRYLEGVIGGTTYEDWFCPGIGVVWHNAEHHGTPYGNRQELASYKVR